MELVKARVRETRKAWGRINQIISRTIDKNYKNQKAFSTKASLPIHLNAFAFAEESKESRWHN